MGWLRQVSWYAVGRGSCRRRLFPRSCIRLAYDPYGIKKNPLYGPHKEIKQEEFVTASRPILANDIVLVRDPANNDIHNIPSQLQKGQVWDSLCGKIPHDNFIDSNPPSRFVVLDGRFPYMTDCVGLPEYTNHSRRLARKNLRKHTIFGAVRPIVPAVANTIVEVLKIEFGPEDREDYPTSNVEILEAGTGYGLLTLFLTRTIHGMNRPLPKSARDYLVASNAERLVYFERTMTIWLPE